MPNNNLYPNGDGYQTIGNGNGTYTNTGTAYAWGIKTSTGSDVGTGASVDGNTTPIFGIDPTFGTPLTGPTTNNDFYQGGSGSGSVIDGLDGLDTAVYSGKLSDYQITYVDGKVVITGPNGTETLVNFERAQFGDVTVVFNYNTPKTDFLYQLYQSSFDRIPDLKGYEWWAGRVQNENLNELDLAKGFLAVPENVVRYGTNVSNNNFIANLYNNILDRAPEQQGYDYWLGKLNAGMSRAEILVAFTVSQENQAITAPHMDNGLWMSA